MKRIKRTFFIFICVFACFALAACEVEFFGKYTFIVGDKKASNEAAVSSGKTTSSQSQNASSFDASSVASVDNSSSDQSSEAPVSSASSTSAATSAPSSVSAGSTSYSAQQSIGSQSVSASASASATVSASTGTSSYSASQSSSSDQSSSSEQSSSSGQSQTDNKLLLSQKAVSEGATFTWKETNVSNAKVYYKKSGASGYTQIDGELIRSTATGEARADIVGLSAGSYDFKIDVGSSSSDIVISNMSITAYDRSGYAHFGYTSGVGAYKDDGTLKSDAVVVYVTEANKNTVSANGKTGITNIMNSATSKPLVVRIIGRVTSDTKKNATTYEGKYVKINGLSEKANSGDGTLWGQMTVQNVKNVTLEGIGDDAEIFQWGVNFKRCNSIEVRNLTFTDYPEDACAFEGENGNESKYGNYWIHNNTFNVGKRLFDDSDDQDKKEGDGAIDIRFCHNATYSYNYITGCHKTGLVGGGDSNLQYNLTYHHNYFKQNSSRMPLGRRANMHYYNNYFYGSTSTTMDLRNGAYVFSEGNYFEKCKNPAKCASGTAVKSFNDVFSSCSGTNAATVVNDRTKSVSNSNTISATFDTDSSKFYYNSSTKASNVTYLSSAAQAKTDCTALAGPWKANKLG